MNKIKERNPASGVQSKNRRKWLRFEFASPILFRLISIDQGEPKIESNLERAGELLDISAGGVLLATKKPVTDGNFITLNLNLKGVREVQGILGKVKRVEESEQGDFLVGVEFCSIESFPQLYQQALTQKNIQSFDKKIMEAVAESILARRKDRIKV
ncbi:MAG: PilZ domain-containing protein [Candidatus Zixiibacteriota bacterium]